MVSHEGGKKVIKKQTIPSTNADYANDIRTDGKYTRRNPCRIAWGKQQEE